MSRKGNCYDNALAESFFATLKTECLGDCLPQNYQQARTMIFDYIETFYNPKRLHSALDYQSPVDFEQQFHGRGQALVWFVFGFTNLGKCWGMVVMPRQLRIDYPGAIHHVMSRGD